MMNSGILHDGFTPPFIKDGVPDARIKRINEKAKSGGT